MENHHHCSQCGNMIAPSKNLCDTCRKNGSLKASIPEKIIAFLDLKDTNKLEWKMDLINNEKVAIVKKEGV